MTGVLPQAEASYSSATLCCACRAMSSLDVVGEHLLVARY